MTTIARLTLPEADARRLAEAIGDDESLGHPAVAALETGLDRWEVTVYFEEAPAPAALAMAARSVLSETAPPFTIETLPDTDWVAKSLEGLPPVRAGRFLVHGSHDRAKRHPNDTAIEIEAGEAFGTGHHGTTAGCLLAIDRELERRAVRRALDVGTGTGVLAIALAKRGVPVVATDIDPVAVRVARANARANGVAARVAFVCSGGLDRREVADRGSFDLIVANILAGPLVALAPAICRRLAPGGTVMLSGLLPDQRARIVSAYRGQGLKLLHASVREGWLTLVIAG